MHSRIRISKQTLKLLFHSIEIAILSLERIFVVLAHFDDVIRVTMATITLK